MMRKKRKRRRQGKRERGREERKKRPRKSKQRQTETRLIFWPADIRQRFFFRDGDVCTGPGGCSLFRALEPKE